MPGADEFMLQILRVLADGQQRTRQELIELSTVSLGLTMEQRAAQLTSGRLIVDSRVGSALTRLVEAGAVVRPRRGSYAITDTGQQLLVTHPGGLARENSNNSAVTSRKFPRRLRWGPMEKVISIVGGLAALAALIPVLSGFISHLSAPRSPSKLQVEESMVKRLKPGDSYGYVNQIIGTQPTHKIKMPSNNVLYQYDRQWEDLQLLVNPAGSVLSVGLYSKFPSFQPVVRLGSTSTKIYVDRPLAQHPLNLTPDKMDDYCGAHKSAYFEEYDDLSDSMGAESIVIGVSDADTSNIDVSGACEIDAIGAPICPNLQPSTIGLSADYARCVLSSLVGQKVHAELIPSVLIVTAPTQQVLPDMLDSPDSVEAGL